MKKCLVLGTSSVCIAAVFMVACGGRDDAASDGSLRTVDRVIDDRVAEGLSIDGVVGDVEFFGWDFGGATNPVAWDLIGIEVEEGADGQGVVLQTTSVDPQIVLDVEFDSQSVDTIKVAFREQPKESAVELFWSAKATAFHAERGLKVFKGERSEPEENWIYSFAVGEHPLWNGSIDRIRIDPVDKARQSVDLVSVSGFKPFPNRDRIADLASKAFRIDQCGDVRSGRVLPPGMPLSLPIDIPAHAKLRFSYGIQDGVMTPANLKMHISRGGDSELVFEEEIVPEEALQCRWHEKVIDLGSSGKGRAELVFEARADEEFDPGLGFPVVSQIEVLAPVAERRPNIVLIVVDTLRSDRMSLYGYERETTANISAWANRDGVVFENAITDAPWTLPSHVSLFTGLSSLSHGVTSGDPISAGLEMFAERLQKHGYRTAAFTGGGYLGEDYKLLQGFDTLSYWFKQSIDAEEVGNDIEAGLENALGWLEQTRAQAESQPFLLFFHTYEAHTPYRERQPFFSEFHTPVENEPLPPVKTVKTELSPEDGFQVRKLFTALNPGVKPRYEPLQDSYISLANDLYDSGVAFADLKVGKLLTFLDESGLSENTIVVFASDHGESLGEKGLAGHSRLEEWELRVPLVIAGPGLDDVRGTRVSTQVRMIDIMPTILDLAEVDIPADIDGVSLLPAIRGETTGLPGDAVSYASTSNFGLALRRGNQLKYEFNNAVWEPIFATERLCLLEEDSLCEENAAGVSSHTRELRSDLLELFNETKVGLRMQFSNNSTGDLNVSLSGRLAGPLRVKSVEPDTEALRWEDGTVHFSVETGTQRTLYFEGSPFDPLSVQCEIEGSNAGTFDTTIGLESNDESWQVVHTEAGWIEDDGTDLESQTGVRAWIHDWPSSQESAAEVDEQTLKILRALGYAE